MRFLWIFQLYKFSVKNQNSKKIGDISGIFSLYILVVSYLLYLLFIMKSNKKSPRNNPRAVFMYICYFLFT
nr:MAG TPA: hypothetical protein [Caudoviricetes sp.]